MYPVDAIKVWGNSGDSLGKPLISIIDPNANRQPYTGSYVFGYYERCRPNFIYRRCSFVMEGNCKCGGWCWYDHVIFLTPGALGKVNIQQGTLLNDLLGPAHAVYFGTYEAVKQKLGGNVGSEHHPFAVGMASIIFSAVLYVNL